jgi:hypothetical protein
LEWLPRLVAWIGQARYLYGAWPVTGLILAFSLLPGVLAVRQNRARRAQRLSYAQRVDLLLLAYVLCYLSLHVFVTFQPWDRYLLPILPLVAILAARGLIAAYRKLSPEGKRLDLRLPLTIGTTTLLAWGAWMGVSGRLPVGSDHGAFENLEKVISFAQARPSDALIYQHSLGWYFDFYLFDAPQERPWWDNSWKLAELASRAANASADREQWLVLTEWEDPIVEGIPAALAGWGLTLREEQVVYRRDQTPAFTIYRIVGSKERSYP